MSQTVERQKTYPRDPDYIIPIAPGEHLKEKLDEMGMTDDEFAERAGLPVEAVWLLYKGIIPVEPALAAKLEEITRMPTHLWLNFERRYRDDLKKAAEKYGMASAE